MKRHALGPFALASLLFSGPAIAATCNVSAQGVSFGTYDSLDPADTTGIGQVSVVCDTETTASISLGSGNGSYSERLMTSGQHSLVYNLFVDPSHLMIWGDGTAGTSVASTTGANVQRTVYGHISAQQNVPAGLYSETVVVTITY